MYRLADYFVIVGFDHSKTGSGVSGTGKIIQRFPEKDWENCPFIQGIELFCQPNGWHLSAEKKEPTFFVSVLTDVDAYRHYCACLTFSEDVVKETRNKILVEEEEDEAEEDDESIEDLLNRNTKMYAPKSLALVSSISCFDVLKNCLTIIYANYIDNLNLSMEKLVSNLLSVTVSSCGIEPIKFSIGAGDRQVVQPSSASFLPVTQSSVALLFQQLGLSNTLKLFSAALCDHKILFHSLSFSRLTESSNALYALMYPLKYSYVFIPVLPVSLIEVLSTPTPFIAGVHTSHKPSHQDLSEVIVVDLDGGSLRVPDGVFVPKPPKLMRENMRSSLQKILRPDLVVADIAFASPSQNESSTEMLDKKIRAVFIKFFADLFSNYRSCLNVVRIHPNLFITFQKATFLGNRNLVGDEFTKKVLDSMSFSFFVSERGSPYRTCDLFDEVLDKLDESTDPEGKELMGSINLIANKLYFNEHPSESSPEAKIPRPTPNSHLRVHQPSFPLLDSNLIKILIQNNLSNQKSLVTTQPCPRIVPSVRGLWMKDLGQDLASNARKLDVLKSCIIFIFDNKISEARKIFPAVLRVLKSKLARLTLINELNYVVRSKKSQLEHQQFDLVVKLLNCTLQNESVMDENGVAAAILPLVTSFCRKLFTGVVQFAYSCVQGHPVWSSAQFWESCFYQDVQLQIYQLYASNHNHFSSPDQTEHDDGENCISNSIFESKSLVDSTLKRTDSRSCPKFHSLNLTNQRRSIAALDIAAERIRIWPKMTEEEKNEAIKNEESTIYSQAIHYANRMVYLLILLDSNRNLRDLSGAEGLSLNSIITNSAADSDSIEGESRNEESVANELQSHVTKFVLKFIDKISQECGIDVEHVKSLQQMVLGVIDMQVETLDAIQKEISRLPPIPKPRIMMPILLPGEELVVEGLRAHLLCDGREDFFGLSAGSPSFLPAEGAIFLSNYRIIFKGLPCDPFVSEQSVNRSISISSMTKDKKLPSQYLHHKDQWLSEVIQIRSASFQLLKIAFDEEVSSEEVECLRKLIHKFRYPPSIFFTFAFNSENIGNSKSIVMMGKSKDKNNSIKNLAKRTLIKTAKKAGIKSKDYSSQQQGDFSHYQTLNSKKYIPSLHVPSSNKHHSENEFFNYIFSSDSSYFIPNALSAQEIKQQIAMESKTEENLCQKSYCKDFQRLGLGVLSNHLSQSPNRPDQFRLTLANINSFYTLCPSYPAVIPVPYLISDENLNKISKNHRHNRFPIATWRHQSSKALLLRASSSHNKGVMGVFKGHYNNASGQVDGRNSSSVDEQERYLAIILSCVPPVQSSYLLTPTLGIYKSQRYYGTAQKDTLSHLSSNNKSHFQKVLTNFKTSSTKEFNNQNPSSAIISGQTIGHKTPTKDLRPISSLNTNHSLTPPTKQQMLTLDQNFSTDFCKPTLYILGEKSQTRGLKLETMGKCEFVPIEFDSLRSVKLSFKKFMRTCVPSGNTPSSTVTTSEHQTFNDPKKCGIHRNIQDSGWFHQLEKLLKVSGTVIDLIDLQGSSVMVCLEDGWDFTTQIISLSQLLLDPYYRTIKGFQVLIEKEWLAFGHRFGHRGNQTSAHQTGIIVPIFLQFLDVVHQIHKQYPMCFEFNEFYLKFLAYHSQSNRFSTFLLDSELKRLEIQLEIKRFNLASESSTSANGPTLISIDPHEINSSPHPPFNSDLHNSQQTLKKSNIKPNQPSFSSIWDYIDYFHHKSPVFYNFLYCVSVEDEVLRPCSSISNLDLWDFYSSEDLSTGCPYDLELRDFDLKGHLIHSPDAYFFSEQLFESSHSTTRQLVSGFYDNLDVLQQNAFDYLLAEIYRLESLLNETLSSGWMDQWKSLESPNHGFSLVEPFSDLLTNNQTLSSWEERKRKLAFQNSNHRKLTVEMLYKGFKMVSSRDSRNMRESENDENEEEEFEEEEERFREAIRKGSLMQKHSLSPHYFTTPSNCVCCHHLLWGFTKPGYHCTDCGFSCHEKCKHLVPNNCTGNKTLPKLDILNPSLSIPLSRPFSNFTESDSFPTFASASVEHRTHEGYLYKRGVMLKGWKMRWFVLDSVQHQLRYYDSREDSACKGLVDLAEVEHVRLTSSPSSSLSKKNEEGAYFELKTSKRLYTFYAEDANSANDWVDRIQYCL